MRGKTGTLREASGNNATHARASADMKICSVCKGGDGGQGVSGWAALFVLPFARRCNVFVGGARRVGLAHRVKEYTRTR